jgi:hypothetical protein
MMNKTFTAYVNLLPQFQRPVTNHITINRLGPQLLKKTDFMFSLFCKPIHIPLDFEKTLLITIHIWKSKYQP